MRSWLPFGRSRQRKNLVRHMRYIYTSDWLIKLEGINSLSQDALADVCTVDTSEVFIEQLCVVSMLLDML